MTLSPKEVQVLTLAALGYSDKEIAQKLKIKYGTVRHHMDRLILKLNANNRTHAAIIYKMKNKDWLEEYYETNNCSLDCRRIFPN